MVRTQPNLSVVILTCDRPDDLDRALDSVLAQDVLPAEIVLVDDGAIDPGPRRARLEAAGVRLVYHRKDRRGISRSRNIGAAQAGGDLIMYLDDDERMEPGYIAALLDVFAEDTAQSIIGAAGRRAGGSGSPAGRLDPLWGMLERFFLLGSSRHRILPSGFANAAWDSFTERADVEFLGGTATYRRRAFARHRFDEDLERFGPYAFGEDLAFSYSLRALGRRVAVPQAVVAHHRSPASRPPTRDMARLRLCNQYHIYRRYLRGSAARPLPFAWAVLGLVILRVLRFASHPSRSSWEALLGTMSGTTWIIRQALLSPGSTPAPTGIHP
jgi:GT2 family glycosyltransferase